MVKRKRDQQKKLYLSKEEKDEADQTKKNYDLTDHTIYRLGVQAAQLTYGDRIPGRTFDNTDFKFGKKGKLDVGYKFSKDRPITSRRCEGCGYYYKSDASPGGSICPRCKYNSAEIRKSFRQITCSTCGNRYYTARDPGSSSCWKCGKRNTEIKEFVWKKPKTGSIRNKHDIANAHLDTTAESDFNAEQTVEENRSNGERSRRKGGLNLCPSS